MSIFGILNTGRSGMMAHSYATSVTAQNASNAATPGYTRRMARLENVAPPEGGVRARGSRRVIDPFINKRMMGAGSSAGYGHAKAQALGVLDVTFADSAGNIGEAIGAFEGSLVEFSAYPAEDGTRTAVLSRAETLTQTFRTAAQALDGARADTNQRIEVEVAQINRSIERIAELGAQISRAEVDGTEASDLRDLRDQELTELAERAPITVLEAEHGGINVSMGGVGLVDEDHNAHLLSSEANADGDTIVTTIQAGIQVDISDRFTGGSVGGLIDARDGGIADARNDLDALAFEFAAAYNTVHNAGFGLDGASGRNLFDAGPTVDGAARRLTVSADVAGQPERLAGASAAADIPGGADTALAMIDLSTTDIAEGGTATGIGAFSNLVARAGTTVRSATDGAESASAALSQLGALRDSVSGVSTDDEMVNLMELQRGYQATLKVVQTADEMLESLINLKR